MKTETMLYVGAAVLAGLALWQIRRPAANTDGSGGRPWSAVPDQSAAETQRLALWATTFRPVPDQSDAETARLIRQANPYRW